MKRRDFLKTSVIGLGSVVLGNSFVLAKDENIRTFRVVYDFDIKNDEKIFSARLWNPLPYNASYQKINFLKFSGNYYDYNINRKNNYDALTFFAKWEKSDERKLLHIEMEIQTIYRSVDLSIIKKASKKNIPIPNDIKKFLEPTSHIPTTGKVKHLADQITQNINDRFEKVQAIYDWVTKTTFRDPKVKGCGVGDVNKILESGYFGGKCTDISSLFVALLRSVGIPAREIFGIRVGKSNFSNALGKSDKNGFADISTWQHCRTEYYIPGAGWIPSDPADITKLELVEGLKYDHPKVQELRKRYINSWEMNWIGFNYGRDFVLNPKPEIYPINMFGYPYGEVNEDDVLNYYDPDTFNYKITSQEL
ncbi:MAG TPA: transglutaminase domain-containing protein [Arcobacter sp.]|nr:transglutaminase domain-containing protein [Arcobacter sp.]